MDKYIVGTNSSGKTRRMLEEASNSGAVVVCKNPYHMRDKSEAYGITGLNFIAYEEFNTSMLYGKKVAIDELGDLFKSLYGINLDGFTMTVD